MNTLDAGDPDTRSRDLVADNLARLRELFPEAWTEGRIDFNVLRQLLGDVVDDSEEKYGLTWHGKRRARAAALAPSTGTLRPCPQDSVEWDTTQHLMIEGDNLEVLKLLQKSYSGAVKLIYIDPPYNTGTDLVYRDDFRDSIGNYLSLTGQSDGPARLTTNSEAGGRFHTNWLNMMYPRLKLARSLLTDDGVLVVSINDVEQANLRRCLDELFGEENFVEQFVWKKSYGGGAKERYAVTQHEYCLMYARRIEALESLWLAPDIAAEEKYYEHRDAHVETRGPFRLKPLEATKSMGRRENLVYPLRAPDGSEVWPKRQWWWSRERAERVQAEDGLMFTRTEGGWTVSYKQYLITGGEKRGSKPFSIIDGIYGQQGTAAVRELFDDELVFSFPKPVQLVSRFIELGTDKDSLVLDFFAGSGTTAQAVMEQNAVDGGVRRCLLVQLPEALDPADPSQAVAAKFCDKIGRPHRISELTKERWRRAGAKTRADHPLVTGDVGFRVFKLDQSNIEVWNPSGESIAESLLQSIEHVKRDRSDLDILFELLLKLGFDLSASTTTQNIAGHEVVSIADGALIVCLSGRIENSDIESLALGIVRWHGSQASNETAIVFRDSAFADDVGRTNLGAILAQHGLTNVRSL